MNIASIDIGTNTVLLLIAEYSPDKDKLITILNEYRMPRLGRGLKPGGEISKDSVNRLMDVLTEYKSLIEKHNCVEVLVTGTNALRIASNGGKIKEELKTKFGFKLDVIAGKEEARYSFLGSTGNLPDKEVKLVIDIGGGSTELIIGKSDEIIFSHSFPFGAVSFTEKYFTNGVSESSLADCRNEAKKSIRIVNEHLPEKFLAVAVAGTPTSLSCVKQNLADYDHYKVEGSILSKNYLEEMVKQFISLSAEEIKSKYGGIMAGREDIILAGTIILHSICEILNLNEVIVSGQGIRYGAVINYLNKIKTGSKEV